jgi:biofilm PGA synthesis protein PgaA
MSSSRRKNLVIIMFAAAGWASAVMPSGAVQAQESADAAEAPEVNLPFKEFIDEIYKLFDAGQPQKAQRLIDRRLKKGEQLKRLYSLLASAYVHQKEHAKFFESADKAFSLPEADLGQNELALKEIERGFALCYDDAIQMARGGKFEEALVILDALQKYDYRREAMAVDRIVIAAWQGDHKKAITMYEALPDDAAKPEYLLNAMIGTYQASNQPEKTFVIYQKILNAQPQNAAVRDFAQGQKIQVLRDLQASSLVVEKAARGEDNIPTGWAQEARGDLAMHHIRWGEKRKALEMLNVLLEDYSQQMAAKPADAQVIRQYWRTRSDRLLALKELSLMKEVIKDYRDMLQAEIEVPSWVHLAAADAYLYEHDVKKAREIYESEHTKNPKDDIARLGLFHTFSDLREFKKAGKILEQLDNEMPKKAIIRGVLQENWVKADVVINKAWLLMYQDRLKEAYFYLEDLHFAAPFNTNIKAARAQNFLWRGWPRRSLRAFEEIQTITPGLRHAKIGYAHALYQNMRKKEARTVIDGILQEEPNNRFALRAQKEFELQEMATLRVGATYLREKPGEDEFLYTLTGEQPIGDHHTLFAELRRRRTTTRLDPDVTRRAYVGDRWDINRAWTVTGALASDYKDTNRFGGFAEVIFSPDDFWRLRAKYEKNTFEVPLRSRAAGVDADEYGCSATFRASEIFDASVGFNFKNFDDGNDNFEYFWRTNTALFTRADWKLRLQSDLGVATYSDQGVAYFSPQEIYTFYLIPTLDHTWYQLYERSFKDTIYVGIGQLYQHETGNDPVGFVQYEQRFGFNERTSWVWGIRYNLNHYDGSDVNSLDYFTTLAFKF